MTPRIISVIGRKNAGKTGLVVALAREWHRQGRRVATIKHAEHRPDVDQPGSDSWRHFHEGLVNGVLVATPDLRVLMERRSDNTDPEALARSLFPEADIVIVEGFQHTSLPKIEVQRKVIGPPLYDPTAADANQWVAIVTDDHGLDARCRVVRFTDTMWPQLLGSLAWEHAKLLTAAPRAS
ncbi:MAG: molybdopterin-guanine dinucleotide biosynthesis protein B [Gemmatimonadota bacterium]